MDVVICLFPGRSTTLLLWRKNGQILFPSRALVTATLGLDEGQMGTDTLILDTGINSVDLIQLKSVSEKAFGIAEMPMATMLNNTTVRSLASAVERIQSSRYEDEYNPVVALQHKGAKTSLWLIHPGIGEILVFLGLVQYFPDRPIYGLRARGFDPGESPFDGLKEILTMYFEAVKKQQPHGPYAIAGYSYGSILAFELSKMLEASGDVVQFLGSHSTFLHILRNDCGCWTGPQGSYILPISAASSPSYGQKNWSTNCGSSHSRSK
ncbi:MAG: hypothetical protein LQ349_009825 [Xanthoria aureola]|nr:MAG: hypothetical protein LQ349_009825 [Xanthoria aureola]